MLRHWKALTLFLRTAGAPLDNNLCERSLKRAMLQRKNSLFYKTCSAQGKVVPTLVTQAPRKETNQTVRFFK
jgi:hypothetical protein